MIILERNQAFAKLWNISKQAREAHKKAAERDLEKEEALRGQRDEHNNALADFDKEKAKLEERKKIEVDRLKEETASS